MDSVNYFLQGEGIKNGKRRKEGETFLFTR